MIDSIDLIFDGEFWKINPIIGECRGDQRIDSCQNPRDSAQGEKSRALLHHGFVMPHPKKRNGKE